MNNITENFGSMVFDEQVIREKLPKKSLTSCRKQLKMEKV